MRKLYGLGTGPGDKEYLTLKAVRILKEVDYVFAPNNKGKNMALDTIAEFVNKDKIIMLDYPMKKTSEYDYEKNADIIEFYLDENKTGAFITIGDPMFYSTVINTFSKLSNDIEVEYISGIPSFVAAAGVSKTPLAHVGETFAVIDRFPDESNEKIDSYAILKTHNLTEEKLDMLTEAGFEYKYIERASFEEEKILDKKEDVLVAEAYISLLLARRKRWKE